MAVRKKAKRMTALEKAREALAVEREARTVAVEMQRELEERLRATGMQRKAEAARADGLRAQLESMEDQFDGLRLICFELEEAIERAAEKLTSDARSKAVTSHLAGEHLRSLAKHARRARYEQERVMHAATNGDGAEVMAPVPSAAVKAA